MNIIHIFALDELLGINPLDCIPQRNYSKSGYIGE